MRIVSLLPSATEIVCALGLRERLVGVSHECDWPREVIGLPVVTAPKIDPTGSSVEIDREVRALASAGMSVYRIDEDLLRELRPDVIVTQETCLVCAVSLDEVREATRTIVGAEVELVSLAPLTVDDVLASVVRVGEATEVVERAQGLVAALRSRLDALDISTCTWGRPRVLVLEWLDPPMVAGHWTPELIRIAGGEPVLGHEGKPTRATTWEAIADARPEVTLIAPCGFKIPQTLRELHAILAHEVFASLPVVAVIDGNAYFNRPGPRLVESAEIAAVAIHGRDLPGVTIPAGAMVRLNPKAGGW